MKTEHKQESDARAASNQACVALWQDLELAKRDHGVLQEKLSQSRKIYLRRCSEIKFRKLWSPPIDERRLAAAVEEDVRQYEKSAAED